MVPGGPCTGNEAVQRVLWVRIVWKRACNELLCRTNVLSEFFGARGVFVLFVDDSRLTLWGERV